MSALRFPPPEYLDGILELSDDDELDADMLLDLLKLVPGVWQKLCEALTFEGSRGPKRCGICWPEMFVRHLCAREIHIEVWHKHSEDRWWEEAGAPRFKKVGRKPHRPSKQLVYERFAEMEQRVDCVWEAVGKIAHMIRRADERFGRYWVIDATPSEAHVEFEIDLDQDMPDDLRHALQNRLALKGLSKESRALLRRSSPRRVEGSVAMGKDSPWSLQRGVADQADIELREEPTSNVFEVDGDHIEVVRHTRQTGQSYTRIRVIDKDGQPGLWRRCRDPEAWVRVYRRKGGQLKRIWIGYYHLSVVDALTGATLFVSVFTARRNEYLQYPVAFEGAENILGTLPLAIAADKGFDVSYVYEYNTRRGVGSAIILRADQEERNTIGQDRDEPRCKHCGGETRRVRFDNTKLRVVATCANPATDKCSGQQSFAASADWRRRGPLSRLNPVFWELDRCRVNREHAHKDRRTRYTIGGNDHSSRHKRIGTPVQSLRAAFAALCDMVAVAYRLNLIDGERWSRAFETKRHKAKAAERLADWIAKRLGMGLTVPYGPQAAALGLGPAEPPGTTPASQGRASPS